MGWEASRISLDPFDIVQNFAFYLPYLAMLEIYLRLSGLGSGGCASYGRC